MKRNMLEFKCEHSSSPFRERTTLLHCGILHLEPASKTRHHFLNFGKSASSARVHHQHLWKEQRDNNIIPCKSTCKEKYIITPQGSQKKMKGGPELSGGLGEQAPGKKFFN